MPKGAGTSSGDKGIDGVKKAAILLIALGPEKSSQVFKHLKEEEIEQLDIYVKPEEQAVYYVVNQKIEGQIAF